MKEELRIYRKEEYDVGGSFLKTVFLPLSGISVAELADAAQLCYLDDRSELGQFIVSEAKNKFSLVAYDVEHIEGKIVEYKEKTRMSGINFKGNIIRKGEAEAIRDYFFALGHSFPDECDRIVSQVTHKGGQPVVIAKNGIVMGVVGIVGMMAYRVESRQSQCAF